MLQLSKDALELVVSKLCCPICWEFLQILRGDTRDFIVRGYHTSLYPVELPSWLPEHVLTDMVKRFERHLRRELDIFLQTPPGGHRDVPATKTHKIVESFDSAISASSASSLSETGCEWGDSDG